MRDTARVEAASGLQAQLTLHFLNGTVQQLQSNIFSGWQQNGYQIWMGYDAARYVAKFRMRNETRKYLAESGLWDEVLPEHTDGFFMWESES